MGFNVGEIGSYDVSSFSFSSTLGFQVGFQSGFGFGFQSGFHFGFQDGGLVTGGTGVGSPLGSYPSTLGFQFGFQLGFQLGFSVGGSIIGDMGVFSSLCSLLTNFSLNDFISSEDFTGSSTLGISTSKYFTFVLDT